MNILLKRSIYIGSTLLILGLLFFGGKSKDRVVGSENIHQSEPTKVISSETIDSESAIFDLDQKLALTETKELIQPWSELLRFNNKELYQRLDIYFHTRRNQGILGSTFSSLQQKRLASLGVSLKSVDRLPHLIGFQSDVTLQVVDGYILGTEIVMDDQAGGPAWSMLMVLLMSNVPDPVHPDPMLQFDQWKEELTKSNQHSLNRTGTYHLNDDLSIHYQITLRKSQPSKARVWLSLR